MSSELEIKCIQFLYMQDIGHETTAQSTARNVHVICFHPLVCRYIVVLNCRGAVFTVVATDSNK